MRRQASSVAIGLVAAGVLTYIFLAVVARELDETSLGTFGAVWSVLFFGGIVAYLGVEQTTTVWVAGAGEAGRRILPIAPARFVGLATVAAAATTVMTWLLVPGARTAQIAGIVALAVAAYAPNYLLRGHFGGNRRFGRYGLLVAAEAGGRLVVLGVILLAGGASVEGFLLATATGPMVATALFAATIAGLRFGEVVNRVSLGAVGLLGAANFALIGYLNVGPAIVTARGAERLAAGVFLGFLAVRVPLFLFQSVTATLLPAASQLIADAGAAAAWSRLRRVGLLVMAVLGAASLGVGVVGPPLVELFFGTTGGLGGGDMIILALGMSLTLGALVLQQFHVADGAEGRVVSGWGAALALLLVLGFAWEDPKLGVELGFAVGGMAAAVIFAAWRSGGRDPREE